MTIYKLDINSVKVVQTYLNPYSSNMGKNGIMPNTPLFKVLEFEYHLYERTRTDPNQHFIYICIKLLVID